MALGISGPCLRTSSRSWASIRVGAGGALCCPEALLGRISGLLESVVHDGKDFIQALDWN